MSERSDDASRRLAAARRAKGWSQQQLGAAMGFTPQDGRVRVSRWENGQVRLRRQDLERAAAALGLSLFSLTPETEVEAALEALEAIVRHRAALSRDQEDRLTAAVAALSDVLGAPPAEADGAAWTAYLDRLRSLLVQAHKAELQGIDSGELPGPG